MDNFAGKRSSREDEVSRQATLDGIAPSKQERAASVDVRPPKAPVARRGFQAKPDAPAVGQADGAQPKAGGSAPPVELVMPATLDKEQHAAALEIVSRAPELHRQRLLDELAGHMQMTRKSIESPLGWLNGIARKACTGDVIYTMAEQVASARKAREANNLRVAAAMNGVPEQPVVTDAPVVPPSATVAEVKERLAKTRADVLARRTGSDGKGSGVEKDGLPC